MRNFDLYLSLVNRTRRIGPNTCWSFLEIAADSGGSMPCDTQLDCRILSSQ